jgi:hypothetical protein
MRKITIKLLLAFIILMLFISCDKAEETPCDCKKHTTIAFDLFSIKDVECQPESTGIDENGYKYEILCR